MDWELWKLDGPKILKHAQQIEAVGETFYRQAAETAGGEPLGAVLLELAADEAEHRTTFAEMQRRLARGQPPEAPGGGRAEDAEALAEIVRRAEGTDPFAALEDLARLRRPQDVLRKALQMEEESIALYARMEALLPDPKDREALEAILAEESRHVRTIQDRLGGLEAQ